MIKLVLIYDTNTIRARLFGRLYAKLSAHVAARAVSLQPTTGTVRLRDVLSHETYKGVGEPLCNE